MLPRLLVKINRDGRGVQFFINAIPFDSKANLYSFLEYLLMKIKQVAKLFK